MLPVGFEPTISAGEQPKTYALDRAATGTGMIGGILVLLIYIYIYNQSSNKGIILNIKQNTSGSMSG